MAIIELERSPSAALGFARDTMVVYYCDTPSVEVAERLDAAADKVVLPSLRLGVLVVIESTARSPDPAVRATIQRTLQRFASRIVACAYVIRGNGFGNAAARATIAGILLFVRPAYSAKVFADVTSAARWLRTHFAALSEAEQLKRIAELERFCSRDGPLPTVGPAAPSSS